ncbi:MAG: hypothetical protein Q9227_004519 [Pyrenula ochraceoflavens]
MTEPARKRVKSSNGPVSAFSAISAERRKKPHERSAPSSDKATLPANNGNPSQAATVTDSDIRRLKTLLFPQYGADAEDGPRTRIRLQEQAIADIHSQPSLPAFVRATADLVSATLNDSESAHITQWNPFFRRFGGSLRVPHHREDAAATSEDSMQSPIESPGKGTDGANADVPSRLYAKQAIYAMSWIRFVNAFVDRDVRTSGLDSHSGDQVAPQLPQNQARLKDDEPAAVAVSLQETAEGTPNPVSQESKSETLSFISLNPFSLLSSSRIKGDPLTVSEDEAVENAPQSATRTIGTMHAQAMAIGMPAEFVEVRHRCVHDAEMQPLLGKGGLQEMVRRGLEWVWERYWRDIKVEEGIL